MKNILVIGFICVLNFSCNNHDKRYTQQSPEIDTYKKVIADYENQDWQSLASHYADTAKILNNVTQKDAQTVAQLIAENKEDARIFDSWKYDPNSVEYEMVVTDKGETWVNFWGNWEATLKANGKLYVLPAHITARFVDGKIVREDGYWDLSKLMLDLKSMAETDSLSMKDSIPK